MSSRLLGRPLADTWTKFLGGWEPKRTPVLVRACAYTYTHTQHTYTLTCRIIFAHAMIGCLYYIWTISWFNRLKSEIRVKNITYKFQTDVKIFRHHYNNMFIIRCIPRYSRILCSCCNDIIKITNILYIYSQRVSL